MLVLMIDGILVGTIDCHITWCCSSSDHLH